MRNIFVLLLKVFFILGCILVGGVVIGIDLKQYDTDWVVKVLIVITKAVFAFFIPLWLTWIIFVVFLMTKYTKKFRVTFENFLQSVTTKTYDIATNTVVIKEEPSKYNPIFVIKGFIGNKQVEVSSATTFLKGKKLQNAHDRLQWSFGYADIYKELEVRNLIAFDKIKLTIIPMWSFLSWFPLVPAITISLKFDTEQLVNYVQNNASGTFDNLKRDFIEFYPFVMQKYDIKHNY